MTDCSSCVNQDPPERSSRLISAESSSPLPAGDAGAGAERAVRASAIADAVFIRALLFRTVPATFVACLERQEKGLRMRPGPSPQAPERTRSLLVLDHPPTRHDESDTLQDVDVLEGIAGDRDQVGTLPRLERADLGREAEQVRRVDGGGADRLGGRHAVLYHQLELVGVAAVAADPGVGAEGDLHPGRESAAKRLPGD